MAIKISGNTVIDDSRNLTNAGTVTANNFIGDGSQLTNAGPARVLKPTNTSPANGATSVNLTPTLCGSPYRSLYGKTHTCSCFQVSECSDFSACNKFTCEIAGACTSITVPANCLAVGTQHFFRLRYEDADGCCSAFSDATCFTTETFPLTLGQASFGGFYLGTICAASTCYYLIVAPNATGCINSCKWKTTHTLTAGTSCVFDGFCNTYPSLQNATHPAGNWIATRTINGYSDWYLPARCEMLVFITNDGDTNPGLPAGECFATDQYWTSTEATFQTAWCANFGAENLSTRLKCSGNRIRATRRVPFP